MTNSEDLATFAMWMMIIGGAVGLFGLATIIQTADGKNQSDLSKPLTIVGLCIFFLGVFLVYRWGTYW